MKGKLVLPVVFDRIYPLDKGANLAVLQKGADYFYFKNDMSVSTKMRFKIGDFFPHIKNLSGSFDLSENAHAVITEYNSRNQSTSIYIPPSYLYDLGLVPQYIDFLNPLRKGFFQMSNIGYQVNRNGKGAPSPNWLQSVFYSVREYFLGGRTEFYDTKRVVMLDKKNGKVLSADLVSWGAGTRNNPLTGSFCVNSVKFLNDSILVVKTTSAMNVQLYDANKMVSGGPVYHYFVYKNNKLDELPDERSFGFTKYVKMDETYLEGYYMIEKGAFIGDKSNARQIVRQITPEMLQYMKNEIYADYCYKFSDQRWQQVFAHNIAYLLNKKPLSDNVDNQLTAIDKYNINWIDHKLQVLKSTTLAAR